MKRQARREALQSDRNAPRRLPRPEGGIPGIPLVSVRSPGGSRGVGMITRRGTNEMTKDCGRSVEGCVRPRGPFFSSDNVCVFFSLLLVIHIYYY